MKGTGNVQAARQLGDGEPTGGGHTGGDTAGMKSHRLGAQGTGRGAQPQNQRPVVNGNKEGSEHH